MRTPDYTLRQMLSMTSPGGVAGDEPRASVGMFYPLPAATRSVYGGPVAVREFVRAALTHAGADRIQLFAGPASLGAARRDLDAQLGPARSSRPVVQSSAGLPRLVTDGGIGTWHAPGIGRVTNVFDLRECLAERPYPITLTHHTISYHTLLHELFLPLLIGGVREYDSLICTSSAARAAVRTLLDAVSASLEARLGARIEYRGRLDLIPLGVDTEAFRPRDSAVARADLGVPEGAFVVLYLGRLSVVDKADLSPLLAVFRNLVRRNPTRRVLLVLAGASNTGAYERQLAERVAALGLTEHVRVERPEIQHPWLAAADVFVAPSDSVQESFGLTVVEALASGVPQVVSDWSGYRDIVAPGATGFLIPTKWMRCDDEAIAQSLVTPEPDLTHALLGQTVAVDTGALESALQTLLDSPDLRARMAEQSRRRALDKFSWTGVIAAYHALWDELAATAAADRTIKPRHRPYTVPQYYDAFAHFASEQYGAESTLHLTPNGREAAAGGGHTRAAEDAPLLMNGRLHVAVLSMLADAEPVNRAREMAEVVAMIAGRFGCAESAVRRHVMWLVKQGLIDLRGPVG